MTRYSHICGAQLDSREQSAVAGFDHRIEFVELESRHAVERCPKCNEPLATALREGQLIEHPVAPCGGLPERST